MIFLCFAGRCCLMDYALTGFGFLASIVAPLIVCASRLGNWSCYVNCRQFLVGAHTASTQNRKEKEQQKIQLDSSANNVAFFSEFSLNALE